VASCACQETCDDLLNNSTLEAGSDNKEVHHGPPRNCGQSVLQQPDIDVDLASGVDDDNDDEVVLVNMSEALKELARVGTHAEVLKFGQFMKTAQDIQPRQDEAARERKRPRHYTKNLKRTQRRRTHDRASMAAAGEQSLMSAGVKSKVRTLVLLHRSG
jgi:hypothetical protein